MPNIFYYFRLIFFFVMLWQVLILPSCESLMVAGGRCARYWMLGVVTLHYTLHSRLWRQISAPGHQDAFLLPSLTHKHPLTRALNLPTFNIIILSLLNKLSITIYSLSCTACFILAVSSATHSVQRLFRC